MNKRFSFAFLVLAQAMSSLAAEGVVRHAHDTPAVFTALYEQLGKIPESNVVVRVQLLDSAEKQIREASGGRQELADNLVRLGQTYLNYIPHLGPTSFQKSVALFKEVSEMKDVSNFRRVDAYRMLGQTLLYNCKDPRAASGVYDEMIDLIKSCDEPVFKTDFIADALSKAALAQQRLGNLSNSVAFREELLASSNIPESERPRALVENARDFAKLGSREKAVASYDRLFKQYPEYGLEDGTIVSLKFERIDAFGYDEKDVRRQSLIEELWNDKTMAHYPRIYSIGTYVAQFYKGRNDQKYLQTLDEIIEKLDLQYAGFGNHDRDFYDLDDIYQDVLLSRGDAYVGQGKSHLAIQSYEKYLKLFPNGRASAYARGSIERLKEGRKGEARQPAGKRFGVLILLAATVIPAVSLLFVIKAGHKK